MSLKTRAKAQKAAVPQHMAVEDIPSTIEVELTLERAAHLTPKGTLTRNQYRGRINPAGTVRVRAYVPGDYKGLAGEIFNVTVDDATLIVEPDEDADDTVSKVEWDGVAEPGVLLVLWAPEDADINDLKVIIG